MRPHILFLFSDTGGGHRSAAEAIIEALALEFGDRLTTEMVDIFKDLAPRPFNHMPSWYPHMMRFPQLWGLGYRLSNGYHRTTLISTSAWPYIRRSLPNLIREHPSDLIVSVHPISNTPLLQAIGKNRPPFITMVTDMVSTHAFWYDRRADLCLVPTEGARNSALRCKLDPQKVMVVGLPVASRFCQPVGDKATLRQELGWPQQLPMVLLVGGGEGMGPLEKNALAIAEAGLNIGLAIITGRNQKLRSRLESRTWPVPTFVYGFVRNMPEMMQAADVLVTKAGPGTITEALNAGLPMILYSRLPGQEEGNVSYITQEGAGVWAPDPDKIVRSLREWINNPKSRLNAVKKCRALARPNAAHTIARILAQKAGLKG